MIRWDLFGESGWSLQNHGDRFHCFWSELVAGRWINTCWDNDKICYLAACVAAPGLLENQWKALAKLIGNPQEFQGWGGCQLTQKLSLGKCGQASWEALSSGSDLLAGPKPFVLKCLLPLEIIQVGKGVMAEMGRCFLLLATRLLLNNTTHF